jgi:hypothetical protein
MSPEAEKVKQRLSHILMRSRLPSADLGEILVALTHDVAFEIGWREGVRKTREGAVAALAEALVDKRREDKE